MKKKEMSKSQLPRNLAIPAYDMRHLAAIPSLSAAMAKSRADNMRHLAAMAKSRADNMRHLPEIHKRVRADFDRFSKSLVDFSRLNAGTVKSLEVLTPDSRQANFPYPTLIGGPTEGILDQREPLNEPSTDLTPAVSDDVFVEKVFLGTGSDKEANQPVARFIEKLGFKVIILDEQPNQGRTRIEKFENCLDNVNFAVILLTPDDIGKSKDEQGKPKFRPSQDSIAILVACMIHLGRDRTCCLYKGELELPSTMDGIILTPMDPHSGWELKLVREMKAAGLPVELKKVI